MLPAIAFAVVLGLNAQAPDPTLTDFLNAARTGDLAKVKSIGKQLVQGPTASNPKDLVTMANQIVGPVMPVDLTADPELVQGALHMAQHAIELDPRSADAYEVCARALIYSGEYDKGIADMKKSIDLSTTPEMIRQRKETLTLLQRSGSRTRRQDPSIDNWATTPNEKFTPTGTAGKVRMIDGNGPAIICFSLGYGSKIFDPLVSRMKGEAKFYLVTPAGMDHSLMPAPPTTGTSFGDRTWSKNLEAAILNLIDKSNLKDVVLLADDYASPQVALHLAQDAPEKIAKVILINPVAANSYPRAAATTYVDTILAPKWYKTVTKQTWSEGMPHPAMICHDHKLAMKWYDDSLVAPIPVLARYFSESLTDDILNHAKDLPQRILVVVGEDPDLLATIVGSQQKASLAYWKTAGPNVQEVVVENARSLVSIDNPDDLAAAIRSFLHS